MNFESMPLKKSFWRFILPSVLAQWVYALYTMVDGMFVANGVGETALSSVNIAMPFVNFLFSLSILFAVGTSTVIAISMGQGNEKEAHKAFTQNMIVLGIISVITMVLIFWQIDRICIFLGATEATFHYVKTYILSILPFAGCFIYSYSFEILVKTDGYPRFATAAVITGALINCVLDYLFVFVFPWGIAGAGVATGISQFILIIIYLKHFLSPKTTMKFVKTTLDLKRFVRVFKIGLSSGVTELSSGAIIFMFNHMILRYIGEQGLVSYTIIAYVNTIVTMSMIGIAQGVQPLISFYFGKEDYSSCRKLLKYTLLLTAVTGIISFGTGIFGAEGIVSMFIHEDLAELAAYSAHAMKIFSISFLILGFNVVAGGFFTSVEQPKSSLAISVCRGFISIAAALEICALLMGGPGIWWSQTVSDLICLVLTLILSTKYKKSALLFEK